MVSKKVTLVNSLRASICARPNAFAAAAMGKYPCDVIHEIQRQ
jgi:hypothetical protein